MHILAFNGPLLLTDVPDFPPASQYNKNYAGIYDDEHYIIFCQWHYHLFQYLPLCYQYFNIQNAPSFCFTQHSN